MALYEIPMVGIMAPPGAGKTHFAATFIPAFNEAVATGKPRPEPFYAKNVVWLLSDRGGADTLAQYNVFPEVIDWVATPLSYGNPFESAAFDAVRVKWLQRKLEDVVKLKARIDGGEKIDLVVVDSMTTLVRAATDARLADEYTNSKFNKQRAYGLANMDIGLITAKLKALPCPVVILAHCRSAYEEEKSAAVIAELAADRPVEAKLELDVQAGVRRPLEQLTSLWAGLEVSASGEHKLITRLDKKFAVKSRWEAVLPPNPKTLREVIESMNRHRAGAVPTPTNNSNGA